MMSLPEYIDDEEVKNMLVGAFFSYFFGKLSHKNRLKLDLIYSLGPS